MRNFLSALESAVPLDPGKDKAGQLIDKISSAISLGLLRAGDKLPSESQLAEMLQVSVPTLREALAELRDEGVIETRRGRYGGSFLVESPLDWRQRGTRMLKKHSVSHLRDFGDHATTLLGSAAALACHRASGEDVQRLRELVHRARTSSDLTRTAIDDSRFHIEVAVVSQSMQLTQAAVRLQSRLAPLLWARPGAAEWIEAAHAEHEAIVDAIEQRDAQRASRLMEEHLRQGMHELVAAKLALYRTSDGTWDPATAEQEIITFFSGLVDRLEEDAAAIGERVAGRSPDGGSRPGFTTEALQRSSAVLDAYPVVAGAGAIFAVPPDPASSDCVYWWARNPAGVVERLLLDTVAGTDKFYDFRSQPWFFRVREEDRPVLHGPYIDYLGYDEYILTLAAPIRTPDGHFLGIFGADLGVGDLEAELLPPLLALGREAAAVVSDTGRVLVGSSPRWTSGRLVDEGASTAPSVPLEPPSLGLRLVLDLS